MTTKLRVLLGGSLLVAMLVAVALPTATAGADPTQAGTAVCMGASPTNPGTQLQGSYSNLVVTGNSYVAAGTSLVVTGNLTIAPGGCLDAFSLGNVNVSGNILVGKGAILGLGCAPFVNGPPGRNGPLPPCYLSATTDTVGGNIIANQPLTMYLSGDTVYGNVVSNGGGPTSPAYVNYPIKNNTILGNLIVHGWHGSWFGALRNTVYGNLDVSGNISPLGTALGNPDSTEIDTNTVSGNLICHGNNPPAQLGDAVDNPANGPNTVMGQAIGECAAPGMTT